MAHEAQNGAKVENGSNASAIVFKAVKPWLVVESPKADDAVQFYKAAFGAVEVSRTNNPKRKAEQELPLVLSAELKLGTCSFVVSDFTNDSFDPVTSAVTSSVFCVETEDVEAAVAKAVTAGGTADGEISEGEGALCGGRVGKIKDPYGNVWIICSPSSKKCADVEA